MITVIATLTEFTTEFSPEVKGLLFPQALPERIRKIFVLLTKREVKMAGLFAQTETKSRSIKTQKRTRPILTEQAWSILNDLLHGQKITPKDFAFAGTKRAILRGPFCPLG